MADPLPPSLKIPEVSRFVNRANQLRTIKPAIAYWCEYHAVNQIVAKSLHTADDDAYAYTTTLIERLEATKVEHAEEEAIVDNAVGQATVEMFATQTFDRAERTMRAGKVTRQTADTFDAAATFYDLLREWGELETEVVKKIKFAKWNAARILKAIREGNDPNESNPKMEPEEPELDPNDLEVQDLNQPGDTASHPVTIEDVADGGEPAPEEYFPQVPQQPASISPMNDFPPSVPATAPGGPPAAPPSSGSQIPPQPSPHIPTKLPSQYAPPPPEPRSELPPPSPMGGPSPAFTPQQPTAPAWTPPVPSPAALPVHQAPPPAVPVPTMGYKDINQAQKHAKWAISALNFEDVPTAVQELRNALAMLGTS